MEEIDALLSKNSSLSYRKAAKLIAKTKVTAYNKNLYNFLYQNMESKKLWETLCEIIQALGITKFVEAKQLLWDICSKNIEYDMVTMKASTAYIRITKKYNDDAELIIHFLKNYGYAVKEGALEALGYDRMIPCVEQQNIILDLCWDFGIYRIDGLGDPRYGLVAACAKWTSPKTEEFLNYCLLSSQDTTLIHIAEHSLKKKYISLR
jgi:hypothetical protein